MAGTCPGGRAAAVDAVDAVSTTAAVATSAGLLMCPTSDWSCGDGPRCRRERYRISSHGVPRRPVPREHRVHPQGRPGAFEPVRLHEPRLAAEAEALEQPVDGDV